VREETQRTTVCVFCKLPITQEQCPSVHRECRDEYEDMERRRL
jgi:hypothetical protein